MERVEARRGLVLVFFILFLDVIGIGIIMPVLPRFLEELTGGTLGDAARKGGWLLLVYALMQFIFAPIMGNLSDRYGRRPLLLASVFTFAIDNLISAMAGSYAVLFIGRLLAGISGSSYSTCSAFIADISTDEDRAKNFGLIGIAFGDGLVLGPIAGGLLGIFGPRVPFYGAAALALANFIVAWFLLPETLPLKDRRAFDWRRAHAFGALSHLRRYPGTLILGSVLFLHWLGHEVYPSAWSFVVAARYGWNEAQIGMSLGAFGVGSVIVSAWVLPRMAPVLGEPKMAAIGLFFAAAALAGHAMATQGWMIYAILFLTVLESLSEPSIRSLAAAQVPASEQGELQGALSSLFSVTTIAGPLLFTQLFGFFTGPSAPLQFPSAPFALAALFHFLALGLFLFRRNLSHKL